MPSGEGVIELDDAGPSDRVDPDFFEVFQPPVGMITGLNLIKRVERRSFDLHPDGVPAGRGDDGRQGHARSHAGPL